MTQITKKTIGARSDLTNRIVEIFGQTPEGEVITYEELLRQTNIDIRSSSNRHMVYTAQRVLRKENNIVFDCVHGLGYRRLAPNGIVPKVNYRRKRIFKQARLGSKELETTDVARLTPGEAALHSGLQSVMSIVQVQAKQERKAPAAMANPSPKVEF